MSNPIQERIQDIAIQVGDAMIQNGIHVLIYEAKTTESVYMKFDQGVGNSLRISNHGGKKHLAYRYNIDLQYKGKGKMIPAKYPRYKFGADGKGIEKLIKQISKDISQKRVAHGSDYEKRMDLYQRNGNAKRGFYRKAIDYLEWKKEAINNV